VIRTSVPKKQMNSAEAVRSHKALAEVGRAFRPIHHHLEDRVRARIFLCMLAYYVEWHMREAWRELMFARHPYAQRRLTGPQLPHAAGRTLHHRAQHLRGMRRSAQRLDLPDDHDAEPATTSSLAAPQHIFV
jgi:hypothetical protein